MMHNVIIIEQYDLVNKLHFFHVQTVKGAESNFVTCKLGSWQLFLKPLG